MYRTNQSTENFYKDIITKVLEKSKDQFSQHNISEDVLAEMKKVIKILFYNIFLHYFLNISSTIFILNFVYFIN